MVELGFLVGLIAALLVLDRVLAHVERVRASRAAWKGDAVEPMPAPRGGSRRSLDRMGLPDLEIPPRQSAAFQATVREPAVPKASRSPARVSCDPETCTA